MDTSKSSAKKCTQGKCVLYGAPIAAPTNFIVYHGRIPHEEAGGYRAPREEDGDIATSQIIVPWITVGVLSVATFPWAASKSRGGLVPDWKEVRSSQQYPLFRNLDLQPDIVVNICESHLLGQKGKTVTWPCQGKPGPSGGIPKDVPNKPLHKISFWKGEHGQETYCSLEFPHICDFCASSPYITFINEENLQIEV